MTAATFNIQEFSILGEVCLEHVANACGGDGSTGECIHLLLTFSLCACFEHGYADYFALGVADMLALELLTERQFNDERTQTRSLTFVVEVGTVDGVQIFIEREITADAAPKTCAFELEHELLFAFDLGNIHGVTVDVERIFDEREVQRCGIVASGDVLLEGTEDLLLLVELYISLLTRTKHLADESQQDSYDNHYYRSIHNRVGIAIRIHIVLLMLLRALHAC